jgi:hypothetical protein
MRETFRTEVREFPYAFVWPSHGEGWDAKVRAPAPLPAGPAPADRASTPRRRAGDKIPVYIEIRPKP